LLLRLEQICKQYPAPTGGIPITVLSSISLTMERGESLAVLGPSGSGKSTLLNLIGALDRPTSGAIYFKQRDITQLNDDALAAFRNQSIGFVFQAHYLLPQLSVLENVLLPNLPLRRDEQEVIARAEKLLQRVGLTHRLHHGPSQLSGGECQRVAVVRALINRPLLLLADEPTGSLDQKTAAELGRLLLELNQEEEMACILVTHSLALAHQAQSIYELVNGRLVLANRETL